MKISRVFIASLFAIVLSMGITKYSHAQNVGDTLNVGTFCYTQKDWEQILTLDEDGNGDAVGELFQYKLNLPEGQGCGSGNGLAFPFVVEEIYWEKIYHSTIYEDKFVIAKGHFEGLKEESFFVALRVIGKGA